MLERVKAAIREVKDFPKPGIGFKDITPVVQDPALFKFVIDRLSSWASGKNADLVIGIESRGFLFAAPVAYELGLGLSIIRKKGKLPCKTVSVVAPNEYAVEQFEMHADGIKPGQRVLIVDDLIATGSSTISAVNLVTKLGGEVAGFATLVELGFLGGLQNIKKAHPGLDVFSLVKFD